MTTQRKLIQDTFISKEEHKINIRLHKRSRRKTEKKPNRKMCIKYEQVIHRRKKPNG